MKMIEELNKFREYCKSLGTAEFIIDCDQGHYICTLIHNSKIEDVTVVDLFTEACFCVSAVDLGKYSVHRFRSFISSMYARLK